MTTTEIREVLVAIERALDVPAVDQVAFQARVRAERRRRTAGRALVGAVAAASVVAAAATGRAVLAEPDRASGPAAPSTEAVLPSDTVFLVLDGKLTALDPGGEMHDLGQRSEGVIGWTKDHVYALDDDSHVTVRRTEPPFTEVASPVDGPVQSVALSGDGRYLAWLDNDGAVHRYDVAGQRVDLTFSTAPDAYVAGVSARGVLVFESDGLALRDAETRTPVPVQADGFSFASDVAGDRVVVNDSDGQALLYDVSGDSARLLETFTGAAALGPDGEQVAVIVTEPADSARLEVWDGGTPRPVQGLDGAVSGVVRWAGETTLLVEAGARLYACDIDLRCEPLPVDGEINLGE